MSRRSAGLAIGVRTLLRLGLLPSMLGRFMMTNDAARAGAENAVMAGKMSSDSPHCGALQAAGRPSWRRGTTHGH